MSDSIGSIEIGKKADLVILDGKAPNLRPLQPGTMVSNLVYSGNSSNVKTVICDGAVVMRDRKIMTIDENEVLDRSEGCHTGPDGARPRMRCYWSRLPDLNRGPADIGVKVPANR